MIGETWLRKRFVALHGEGAPHQADFYRCITCGALVTHNKIRTGKRLCCQGRVCPTEPTVLETVRVFLLPWTI